MIVVALNLAVLPFLTLIIPKIVDIPVDQSIINKVSVCLSIPSTIISLICILTQLNRLKRGGDKK